MRRSSVALAAALVALATALVLPAPAEACSCAADVDWLPADGAVEVPTNASIWRLGWIGPASPPRLVAGGVEVAVVVEPVARADRELVRLRPLAPLAPRTEHELVDDTGTLLRFVTGAGPDDTPPGRPAVTTIVADTMPYPGADASCASSCVEATGGRVSRTIVDVTPAADPGLELVELRQDGELLAVVPRIRRPGDRAELELGYSTCGRRAPPLTAGTTLCARPVTLDVAGQAAAGEGSCAPVASCAPILDEVCEPAPGCEASEGSALDTLQVTTGCAIGAGPADRPDGGAGALGLGALGGALALGGAIAARRRRQARSRARTTTSHAAAGLSQPR